MSISLKILVCILAVVIIGCIIAMTTISLIHKSLLCAKIYTFIFEHDDWLLYRRAKKQGIQHYLNGHHFSQFCKEWNTIKEKHGVNSISAADYLKLDEKTMSVLINEHDKLVGRCNYKEYREANESIKDDDIVLSLNTYNEQLYICAGDGNKELLTWEPMVKDIIKSQVIKDRVFYALLADPKMVVSF